MTHGCLPEGKERKLSIMGPSKYYKLFLCGRHLIPALVHGSFTAYLRVSPLHNVRFGVELPLLSVQTSWVVSSWTDF